jgi:ferrochelatase
LEGEERDRRTVGIVLLNLGGPDSLDAVRPFLYNLFSDREIIKLGPLFLQKPLARLISIVRSAKSRKMYGLIGGRSPINDITRAQADALETSLNSKPLAGRSSPAFKVYLGMRYWHPFIKDVVRQIFDDGIRELIVLSLYPHYSKTTTGSSIAEFKRAIERYRVHGSGFSVKYIDQWYDHPLYIDSLAEVIGQGITDLRGDDFTLLYSAHGLPKSIIEHGDPYLEHIKTTIELTNKRLSEDPYNLTGFRWSLSFQSRTGPVEWLDPSTGQAIEKFSGEGVKNLLVVPISFVSDHVETLYEIDILFKDLAKKQGIDLKRCRSLNTSDSFIALLKELVMEKVN